MKTDLHFQRQLFFAKQMFKSCCEQAHLRDL